MSEYQVIARKWRPQRFSDVVGQRHVVQTLENAIRQQRLAHAYLFVGPRGVGKTTLARIFAKAMNCTNPINGEPCCECESCRSIAQESSLDVIEIDAASRNSVADMRELAEDVMHQPVSGRYKIYIVDEVHMLSKQAWNALLKTVEEPPAHAKFIFATTEVHQVLPTIISRCQRFDLLPIQTNLIAERLRLIAEAEHVAINDSAIGAIARAAEGGMRDAQSLLDQMIAFFSQGGDSTITGDQVLSLFGLTDRADLDALLLAMLQNNPGEVIRIIAGLSRKGKNLETLFDDLLGVLRAVQLCLILRDPSELIDEGSEAIERYRQFAKLVKRDTIQIMLETVAPVGRVLHDALNKQVYLETILLKAMREGHAVRIDDLLARLNQLRTAGELKFLEQLPAEIKPPQPEVVVIQAVASAPAPAVIAIGESMSPAVEPSPAAVAVEAPVIPAVEPSPAAVPVEAPVAPTVVEEPIADEVAEVSEPAVEEGVAAESEAVPEVTVLCSQPTITPMENSEPPYDGMNSEFDSSAGETIFIPPVIPNLPEAPAHSDDELQPGHHKRRSIANDNPLALEEAAKNPIIHEILDLFGGKVVDIHK